MSGGWGLAFTPEENRPAQSLAVSRAWRPVTRGGYVDLGGLSPGRHSWRLVWQKGVLKAPWVKPPEAGTVNPNVQMKGEPQTGEGVCLKSNCCWTQTQISPSRRPAVATDPLPPGEGKAAVGRTSEAGWWPRPFPGSVWPWERHCPLGTRSAGHVWLGSTLKLGG